MLIRSDRYHPNRLFRATPFVAAFLALFVAACGDVPIEQRESTVFDPQAQRTRERFGTVTGDDGIQIFSTADETEAAGTVGIGVNAFLWRASLETIDFLPLVSADPFGGLIISDWYQSVEAPQERVKIHVLIRDTVLRADGLKVSVFRQVRDDEGSWLSASVQPETARRLEDSILTRAREIRIAQSRGPAG